MGKYKIDIKRSVLKDIRKFPIADIKALTRKIMEVSQDPYPPGSQKLSANRFFRIRYHFYRIIYAVESDRLIISVIKIGHRSRVYGF